MRITVFLAVTASGIELTPVLIWKGKKKPSFEKIDHERHHADHHARQEVDHEHHEHHEHDPEHHEHHDPEHHEHDPEHHEHHEHHDDADHHLCSSERLPG